MLVCDGSFFLLRPEHTTFCLLLIYLFMNLSNRLPLSIYGTHIHNSLTFFTLSLKPTCFTNLSPVDPLLPLRLPPRTITQTVSSEQVGFTARLYASAIYAVYLSVCPFVRLSQADIVLIWLHVGQHK